MAEFSRYTGRFRINPAPSDSTARKIVKRSRESFACTQCRASKLRCDRSRPSCSSCTKKNSLCSYASNDGSIDQQKAAEDRLLKLESMVSQLIQQQQPGTVSALKPDTPPNTGQGLDGSEYIDHDSDSLGLHYPTVLEDIMDSIQDLRLALQYMHDDLQSETATESSMRGSERIFASPCKYTLVQIVAYFLPERHEADNLLNGYTSGDSSIQPFLHCHQFRQQYNDFWEEPSAVSPIWLSMLFSIFTITSMALEANSILPREASATSPKAVYHTAAGECLSLGQYYRAQPYAPQALLLYAHCVNLKSLDPSREAGAIMAMGVRLAYEMGYHRDPDTFGTFSVFEGEMRRRFWAVCKQIDTMTAFQLGLPSSILLENCDTKSPRNLLDSDFGPHTQILPPSRPESESTGILWFIVKDRLMPSFTKICQDALSLQEKSDEHVRRLDGEVRQAHDITPHLLQVRPLSECPEDSRFLIMARFYLESLHFKSLAILHRRRMTNGDVWSTSKCIDAGLGIVRMVVGVYKEFSPGGQLHQVRWMFNTYYMSDFLLGVIVLCLYSNLRMKHGTLQGQPQTGPGTEIYSLLEQAHGICMEKSSASRDARKVALAIQIALQSANRTPVPQRTSGQDHQDDATSGLPSHPIFTQDPAATSFDSLSLTNTQFGGELSFEALDPFNFMNMGDHFPQTVYDPNSTSWSTFDVPVSEP